MNLSRDNLRTKISLNTKRQKESADKVKLKGMVQSKVNWKKKGIRKDMKDKDRKNQKDQEILGQQRDKDKDRKKD